MSQAHRSIETVSEPDFRAQANTAQPCIVDGEGDNEMRTKRRQEVILVSTMRHQPQGQGVMGDDYFKQV